MNNQVNELEKLLLKLGDLEIQMVELGIIEDGDERSEVIGTIKESIYNEIREISNE